MLFDVSTTDHGHWTVLAVTGELDVASAPRLRQEAVKATSAGSRHLVIDLSGVDFLDSTGLGVVVGLLKRVRGMGGSMVVVAAESRVRKVFELTRVDQILDVYQTLETALDQRVPDG